MLQQVVHLQSEAGPALKRLEALELSRHHFEAEIQGVLLQADGKLKAARNAEARERQLKRSYENQLLDPIDPDGEAAGEGVLNVDAPASETEGVPAVHLALAPTGKAAAVRAKFGL